MLRVVLDANIYVSALLKPKGRQAALLGKALEGVFQPFVSEPIFIELCRVLQYEKIASRISLSPAERKRFLERIVESASWSPGELSVRACEDPEDDIYLSCAKECQADFLVSGDQHLLKMRHFEETQVVTTKWFLSYLKHG